jgi:hypothetical protein
MIGPVVLRRLFTITGCASLALTGACVWAWIQAVRLPVDANFGNWPNAWQIGIDLEGSHANASWYDAYAFVDRFSAAATIAAAVPAPHQNAASIPYTDILTYPGSWPDLHHWEVRILWPLLLSLVAPVVWAVSRRRVVEYRGFPVGALPTGRDGSPP